MMPRMIQSCLPCRASLLNALNAVLIAIVVACATVTTADAQTIRARADGLLEIVDAPPNTVVRYTLDGTEPTRDAGVWLAPVDVPAGYTVKARAFTAEHVPAGPAIERTSSRERPAPRVDAGARHAGPRLARLRLAGAARGRRRVDENASARDRDARRFDHAFLGRRSEW